VVSPALPGGGPSLNRTIVGWKRRIQLNIALTSGSFKSHHSGMETNGVAMDGRGHYIPL